MHPSRPSKPTQTFFQFDKQSELLLEDYAISHSNEFAVKLIQHWPKWNGDIALIYGPPKCGKSHLATIWKQHAQAAKLSVHELETLNASDILNACQHILIEDIDKLSHDTALFHLFNAVRNTENATMLLTANMHPHALDIQLPDLQSRLVSCDIAELNLPDDALMRMLFTKHFADHQLSVTTEVVEYLTHRAERSFKNTGDIVNTLDQLALERKRNITIPFIKEMKSYLNLT